MMQFMCQQDRFLRALTTVGHAVAKGNIDLPILRNICLATDGDRVKCSATNLEIGINTWAEAEIMRAGTIAVPARLFSELIASLPPGTVMVTVTETNEVHVKAVGQQGNNRVRGVSTEEFLPVPGAEQGVGQPIQFNAAQLKEAIKEVSIAAEQNGGARPVLESVLIQLEPEKITFAAADGFRLAFKTIPLSEQSDLRSDILVPVRTLLELSSILPTDGVVQMNLTQNNSQVIFHTPWISLASRLVQGKYPNYRAMLPAERPTRAVVSRSAFADIVKLTALFARTGTKVACLTIRSNGGLEPGTISLASEDSDLGGNLNVIEAAIEGDDQEMAFNVGFLEDALRVSSTSEVTLEIGKGKAPCGVLRPAGPQSCVHFFMGMDSSTIAKPVKEAVAVS